MIQNRFAWISLVRSRTALDCVSARPATNMRSTGLENGSVNSSLFLSRVGLVLFVSAVHGSRSTTQNPTSSVAFAGALSRRSVAAVCRASRAFCCGRAPISVAYHCSNLIGVASRAVRQRQSIEYEIVQILFLHVTMRIVQTPRALVERPDRAILHGSLFFIHTLHK